MPNAREEFADLLIEALNDYMIIFLLQRKISVDHRFTIGQLAKRVLKTKLSEMLEKYTEEKLREMVNLHPKRLREKIKALEQNGHNGSAT